MHFDPTISWGTILSASSFLVAAIIFVVSMKPRIEAIEKEIINNNDWKMEQERQAQRRDDAIATLAMSVKELATLQKNTQERMERMDARFEKFIDAALAGRKGNQ